MYRCTKMSGVVYAREFDDVADEAEDIQALLDSGDSILLTDDTDEAAEAFEVDKDEIVFV